uniref:CCHC-type domain-containing protein n=1 Tax=Sipha flava TaxID=143950 RepID=A0A2S2R2C3_9HEMI
MRVNSDVSRRRTAVLRITSFNRTASRNTAVGTETVIKRSVRRTDDIIAFNYIRERILRRLRAFKRNELTCYDRCYECSERGHHSSTCHPVRTCRRRLCVHVPNNNTGR